MALGIAMVGLSGCGSPGPEPDRCPTPGPAFQVSVSGPEAELPEDLVVTARYGAGEETYRLVSPDLRNEVLFCRLVRPESGGEGGAGHTDGDDVAVRPLERQELECELWTDSSVTFHVVSERYMPLERELQPVSDRCGTVTSSVELALQWPEIE